MENFEKCTVAMLGGPCSQHVMGIIPHWGGGGGGGGYPRWFQDFPAIWLSVPFGANGAHLGICTLPEKIFFVCEISCFLVNKIIPKEISSCEVFIVTKCPYAGINKWMEKI